METPSQSSILPAPFSRGPMSYVGTLPGLQRVIETTPKKPAVAATHVHGNPDEKREDDSSASGAERKASRKICASWYHGHCPRDGSSPERTCKFLHQLEGSCMKLSWQPPGRHRKPCGRELCVLKDGPRKSQTSLADASKAVIAADEKKAEPTALQAAAAAAEPASKSRKRKRNKQPEQNDSIAQSTSQEANRGAVSVPDYEEGVLKRPSHRHPDQPVKRRRTELDYDEGDASGAQSIKDKTCIFWYHGFCPKERDAALGLGPLCDYRHSLTEPPTMAQYPKSGLHGGIACGKEWCPIGRDPRKLPKGATLPSSPQQQAEPKPQSQQAEPKAPVERTNPNADATCFFWYHGHCARSVDPRSTKGCTFLHALTDPPSVVQPPPGYVHRAPCGRDWCPGDAREKVPLRRENVVGSADSTLNYGGDEASSRGETKPEEDDDEKPDWFLEGFD